MKRWIISESPNIKGDNRWRAVLEEYTYGLDPTDWMQVLVAFGATAHRALSVGQAMDRKASKGGGR